MSCMFSRVLMLLALVAAFAPVARGEQAPRAEAQAVLQSVLSNTEIPLAIKLKDLDASWRRFVVNSAVANPQMMMQWGAMAGLEFGVHFTKGQTITMGEQTFLVAYRLPVKIDRRFLNWHGHGDPPRPRKPTPETELNLSLLNLSALNGLNDVRAFDAKTDMESVEQSNAASVRTLEQLGQGLLRYIRARGQFPRLNNPIDWNAKRAFYPYVGDERLFMHPGTQEMYRYNVILGGKQARHIASKQSFAVFYEATPSGDGTRGVLFMDGHVERLSPARWETIKKASKIQGEANDEAGGEEVAAPGNLTNVVVTPAVAD